MAEQELVEQDLESFGYMQGVIELCYMIDLHFIVLRTLHPNFQSGYASLQSHQSKRCPISPHPKSQFLLDVLLICSGISKYFRVILVCTSLIAKDGKFFS